MSRDANASLKSMAAPDESQEFNADLPEVEQDYEKCMDKLVERRRALASSREEARIQ
jgi:hypothetical protein